jgi:serine/threonine protein kinase
MTIPTPPTITTTLARRPAEPAVPASPVRAGALPHQYRPANADLHAAVASGRTDPQRRVDTWPLRATDPAWVGGYRLVSRLGTGGMADVFYAVSASGTPVAVKILRAAGGVAQSCRREYLLASAVPDCTAPALGYGRSAAGAYLVTAYLPGYRSAATLVGGSMSAGQLWTLGSALARALAAVHDRGVVHCDVKPSNLLVRGHDVRLIDFGIARYAGEPCGGDGIVECSRGWAAPEQLRAAAATPAVDVFAWGCVLAYLASGGHPFASRSQQEWILRVQSAEPDLAGVPAGLHEVIRVALARDPRDRPHARELAMICRVGGEARRRPAPRPRLARPPAAGNRRPLARLATGLRRCLRTLRRPLQYRLALVGWPPSGNTTRQERRRPG